MSEGNELVMEESCSYCKYGLFFLDSVCFGFDCYICYMCNYENFFFSWIDFYSICNI